MHDLAGKAENIDYTKRNALYIKIGLKDFNHRTNSHLNDNKNAIDTIEKYDIKLGRGEFNT